MKKNIRWMVLALLLVALIAAAGGLYNTLKDKVSLSNLVAEMTTAPTATSTAAPQATEAPTTAPTSTPRPAPDFTVLDTEGNEVSLSAFKGKPVVLNFWASWCGPCQSEMPAFQQAWEKYGDQVQFMFINRTDGSRETIETAQAFMEKKGYTFPVFFDTQHNAAIAYGVNAIPSTCFISAEGGLVARANGAMSLATLEWGLKMIMD